MLFLLLGHNMYSTKVSKKQLEIIDYLPVRPLPALQWTAATCSLSFNHSWTSLQKFSISLILGGLWSWNGYFATLYTCVEINIEKKGFIFNSNQYNSYESLVCACTYRMKFRNIIVFIAFNTQIVYFITIWMFWFKKFENFFNVISINSFDFRCWKAHRY